MCEFLFASFFSLVGLELAITTVNHTQEAIRLNKQIFFGSTTEHG